MTSQSTMLSWQGLHGHVCGPRLLRPPHAPADAPEIAPHLPYVRCQTWRHSRRARDLRGRSLELGMHRLADAQRCVHACCWRGCAAATASPRLSLRLSFFTPSAPPPSSSSSHSRESLLAMCASSRAPTLALGSRSRTDLLAPVSCPHVPSSTLLRRLPHLVDFFGNDSFQAQAAQQVETQHKSSVRPVVSRSFPRAC